MKQTAVEWLVNGIPAIDWKDPYWKVKLYQAKEMEKEQILDAHIKGHNAPSSTLKHYDAEQYYNETFKQ